MQRDEVVLAVRACTHLLRGADEDADIAAVHFLENLLHLRFVLRALDEDDLLLRNAALLQGFDNFPVDGGILRFGAIITLCITLLRVVLFRFWDALVAENELRALDVRRLLVFPYYFVRERVDLGVRDGHLAQVARERQHVVGALPHVLPALCHIGNASRDFLFDVVREHGIRCNLHDGRFAAFELWNIEIEVILRLHVGEFAEHLRELRHVDEAQHLVDLAETAAARVALDAAADFTEGTEPVVEEVQPLLLEPLEVQVAHHGEHLGHRIGDRRTGCEYDAAPAIGIREPARLGIHVHGAVGVRVRQAVDAIHRRGVVEILEHVRFVDKNLVDAQLLEGNADVARVGLHDRVQVFLQFLLLVFNGAECPLIDFAFLGFRDSLFHLVELFLDEGGGCLRRERQAFELTVRHDDAVPVLRLDLRERPRAQRSRLSDLLAVGSRELAELDRNGLLASVFALYFLLDGRLRHCRDVARARLAVILQDEEPRVRIEPIELLRELFNNVVRQDIERLVRDAEAAHFHASRLHLERLARADAMRDQRVAAL